LKPETEFSDVLRLTIFIPATTPHLLALAKRPKCSVSYRGYRRAVSRTSIAAKKKTLLRLGAPAGGFHLHRTLHRDFVKMLKFFNASHM
jgi:hypothetical protein